MDADEGVDADTLRLAVRGYASEVFDEPATAWALHQETHLLAWRGAAAGPLVDRFDARNLLDDRAQFRRLKRPVVGKRRLDHVSGVQGGGTGAGAGGEQAVLLHRLRYGDYAVEFPDEQPDEQPRAENRFPYRYPDADVASDEQEEEEGEAFTPTFRIPDGVQAPETLKQHSVIQATADKVRGNPRLEVMMKARLGDDDAFAFLKPASRLHAYYCFLRDKNPQADPNKVIPPASAGFLLLGGDYNDSDEEDDNPPSSPAKPTDITEPISSASSQCIPLVNR